MNDGTISNRAHDYNVFLFVTILIADWLHLTIYVLDFFHLLEV